MKMHNTLQGDIYEVGEYTVATVSVNTHKMISYCYSYFTYSVSLSKAPAEYMSPSDSFFLSSYPFLRLLAASLAVFP